jgi:hypothetical protein
MPIDIVDWAFLLEVLPIRVWLAWYEEQSQRDLG